MEKQIGPYNIVRLIGTGGMGSVYEAVHSQIQRARRHQRCYKDFQQDPEFVQRFFNGRAPSTSSTTPMSSRSRTLVRRRRARPTSSWSIWRATRCGSDWRAAASCRRKWRCASASGWRWAWPRRTAKQVIHRDLKPVNILLVPEAEGSDSERAKILDFGIAKLAADPAAKALTRVGVSLGTPGLYVARAVQERARCLGPQRRLFAGADPV